MAEYDKKRKTSKAQQWANETTGKLFRGAANFADQYLGGAGGRQIAGAAAAPIKAAAATIRGDIDRNAQLRKERAAPRSYPDNDLSVTSRTLGENAPFPSVKPSLPLRKEQAPDIIAASQKAREKVAGKPRVKPNWGANGTWKVGNMDVRFDSSVSPEARQRFLDQPSAPGTRRVPGIGMVRGPERQQERKPPETFGEIMQERWRAGQERRAESRRSNAADEALKRRALDQGFFTDQQRIGIGQQQLGIDQQRVGLEGGRLGLDASRVSSENALRDQQMREGALSLGRTELISSLQEKYMNPETPDAEKQQIADHLRFLSGNKTEHKPIVIDQYNDKGFQTGQDVVAFDPRTGQVVGWQQGSGQQSMAPPQAIELLMSDPKKYSESFFQKYGYLPPGV
jgi:hypothetical protein